MDTLQATYPWDWVLVDEGYWYTKTPPEPLTEVSLLFTSQKQWRAFVYRLGTVASQTHVDPGEALKQALEGPTFPTE